jgi:transposase
MINKELAAEILRLHHAEKWPYCTIARALGVHHSSVKRVLEKEFGPVVTLVRVSMVDKYVAFIQATLEKHPDILSSRLFTMARERGYPGRPDHFRHLVAGLRPWRKKQAFLRLTTLPGEQAQVDWGYFGKVKFGRAERRLSAFVMVLSWSRQIFLRFFLNEKLENFLRGHQEAFEFFQGVPRVILYDNLKTAVLERRDRAIRYQETFLAFAGRHRYEPRPVAPRKGNEKGRVERAIRYIRGAFFMAREWKDLADLNTQALAWCVGDAGERKCPEEPGLTVSQALEKERGLLLPLPENPFPVYEKEDVVVGKTPYIRFDLNDYSVPHELCGKTLTVVAEDFEVRICDGLMVVATHPRSYDRHARVENPAHVAALVEVKRAARKERGVDRLVHAVPESKKLLEIMAERGEPLGSRAAALLGLLSCFPPAELSATITEVIARDTPHLSAIRQVLDRRLRAKEAYPLVPVPLPEKARDLMIRPQPLTLYDKLWEDDHE